MELPAELVPLAFLVGVWRGEGQGAYPSIDDFAYEDELRFRVLSKPWLEHAERTWVPPGGAPSHSEMGFLRPVPGGAELVVAAPGGRVEVSDADSTARASSCAAG